MVVPLFKIGSLVVRVLTRPMINLTKKYHLTNAMLGGAFARRQFIKLGNYQNFLEYKINRKFLSLKNKDEVGPRALHDEIALEKGIEFFYELLVYMILILLPTYEIIKAHNASIEKAEKTEKRLQKLESEVEQNNQIFTQGYNQIYQQLYFINKKPNKTHDKSSNSQDKLSELELNSTELENDNNSFKLNFIINKPLEWLGSIKEKIYL